MLYGTHLLVCPAARCCAQSRGTALSAVALGRRSGHTQLGCLASYGSRAAERIKRRRMHAFPSPRKRHRNCSRTMPAAVCAARRLHYRCFSPTTDAPIVVVLTPRAGFRLVTEVSRLRGERCAAMATWRTPLLYPMPNRHRR